MSKECLLVAISNQKGGVGKSALTVVLASYLHYEKDLNVAIIDCDSPQHSLVRMRERDKKAISASPYHQQLVEKQWERTPKEGISHYRLYGRESKRGGGQTCREGELGYCICGSAGNGAINGCLPHHS